MNLPWRESICSLVTADLPRVERSVKDAVKGSKVAEYVVEIVAVG